MVNEECYPYVSGGTGTIETCRVPRRANLLTMKCDLPKMQAVNTGNSQKKRKERKELFRTPPAYRIAQLEEDIMNEIHEHGPVQGELNFFLF